MIINNDSMNVIFNNLKADYNSAWAGAPVMWDQVGMMIPSTGRYNTYEWLEKFPRMREWFGDKVVEQLILREYIVRNKDFEATIEIDRNDIDDDQVGIFGQQAKSAGFSAKQHPDELIFDLINGSFAGANSICYDGQSFFSANHSQGDRKGTKQSNVGSIVLSCAGLVDAQASIGSAFTSMAGIVDYQGRPMGITPDTLLVPPALYPIANTLYKAERLQDGMPNPYIGMFKPVMSARLTSQTAWFLLDTSKPIRPFVWQNRKSPVFVAQFNPDSEDVFSRRKFKFGVESRGNACYGLWQFAFGSTGTTPAP